MVTLRHFSETDAAFLRRTLHNDMTEEDFRDTIISWNTFEFQGRYFEMFAVVNDDKIVGMISLYQHSESVASIGPEIFPAFQQKGFGKEAMKLALETAKQKGYKIAAQQVRCNNTASIALHESLSFETDHYEYINRNGNKVFLFYKALF